MSRYFFHLHDGVPSLDHKGIELLDFAAAREEAACASGELLRDRTRFSFRSGEPWRFWVTDGPGGAGKTLLTLQFIATEPLTPIGLMAEKPWQQFQPARGTTRKCECSPSPRAADAREAILGRQILGQGFLLALSTTRRIQRLRRIVTALEPSIERARAALER
jgi:hypothetical protein